MFFSLHLMTVSFIAFLKLVHNANVTQPDLAPTILILHQTSCLPKSTEAQLTERSIKAAIEHIKEEYGSTAFSLNKTCFARPHHMADVFEDYYLEETPFNRTVLLIGNPENSEEHCQQSNVMGKVIQQLIPPKERINSIFMVTWQCEVCFVFGFKALILFLI